MPPAEPEVYAEPESDPAPPVEMLLTVMTDVSLGVAPR